MSFFFDYTQDQCAVRAAVEGRVLVLEGIEKAERNILPLINNLLENREMVPSALYIYIFDNMP